MIQPPVLRFSAGRTGREWLRQPVSRGNRQGNSQPGSMCREGTMRLDKYLKVSRLIKRRPVANEACDAGRISVNGKVAKASLNVKIGDVIEITFGDRVTKVEVLSVEETYKKDEAKELYRVLS